MEIRNVADFVILSDHPLITPAGEWEERIKVEKTIVEGRVVYEAM